MSFRPFQVPVGTDLRVRPKHSVPARDCRGEPVGCPNRAAT